MQNSLLKDPVLSFSIVIDCCASPTIFTGPSISAASFTYNLGSDPLLSIAMTGGYVGDNACCTVASNAPTISMPDTASIFSYLTAPFLTNDVYSTDITQGDGTYTFTYVSPVHA